MDRIAARHDRQDHRFSSSTFRSHTWDRIHLPSADQDSLSWSPPGPRLSDLSRLHADHESWISADAAFIRRFAHPLDAVTYTDGSYKDGRTSYSIASLDY